MEVLGREQIAEELLDAGDDARRVGDHPEDDERHHRDEHGAEVEAQCQLRHRPQIDLCDRLAEVPGGRSLARRERLGLGDAASVPPTRRLLIFHDGDRNRVERGATGAAVAAVAEALHDVGSGDGLRTRSPSVTSPPDSTALLEVSVDFVRLG